MKTITTLLGVGLALFACGNSVAQDIAMSGSETYIAEAPAIVGGGAAATSQSYAAQISIEGPTVPHNSASLSFRMLGAPALFGAAPTNLPIVFGTSEGTGTKDGGQAITLFGRNLNAPGAGATAVQLGGQPVLNLTVLSNNVAVGTSSQGINAYANPLGSVGATLTNNLGASAKAGAYVYSPAIVQESLAVVDADYGLSLYAPPGHFLILAYGITIPGVALPLFNLDGALEILTQITPVTALQQAPGSGLLPFVGTIPNAPALAGLQLPLQALAFAELVNLTGSFTNMHQLAIQ